MSDNAVDSDLMSPLLRNLEDVQLDLIEARWNSTDESNLAGMSLPISWRPTD